MRFWYLFGACALVLSGFVSQAAFAQGLDGNQVASDATDFASYEGFPAVQSLGSIVLGAIQALIGQFVQLPALLIMILIIVAVAFLIYKIGKLILKIGLIIFLIIFLAPIIPMP